MTTQLMLLLPNPGYWRILETEYAERVVVAILNLLDGNSWSYDRVPMKETCDLLEELEPR